MNRPCFQSISVHAALRRSWKGFILQEKLDGRWHERRIGDYVFAGELMPDGEFRPFDLLTSGNTALRLKLLADVSERLGLRPAATGSGAEFLNAILESGGEGCVAKPANSKFGVGWVKIKRKETHDCIITEIGPGESIAISQDGINRGRVPVTGGKLLDGWDYRPRIAALNVGDAVEIACHSIHPSGMFREARLVRVRDDKVRH